MHSGSLSETISATTAAPDRWLVVATGLFAVAVGATAFVLMVTRRRHALFHINVLGTIVHEAGHASVSVLTGGGVYSFEITRPDSGSTHIWYTSKLSSVATTAAGYAMPTLAGLGAASLLHHSRPAAVLTLTVALMVALLLVVRDVITLGAVVAVGFIAFAALYWAPEWMQNVVAYSEAWLLLTSEIGGVAVLVAARIRGHWPHEDDAATLSSATYIPAPIWILGWFVLIGWGLWTGVPLLWL